jgi:hypothetical protein
MDAIEQENIELREELTTLRADVERLNALVDSLVAAHNQPLTHRPLNTRAQTTIISEIVATPALVAPINTLQYTMPEGYPWGMPYNFNGGYQPIIFEVQPVIEILALQTYNYYSPTRDDHSSSYCNCSSTNSDYSTPLLNEPIYHAEPTESVGAYGRWDDFQEQFDEM